jgi:hypothetical protein
MPLIGILLAQYWKPLLLAALVASALAYRAILVHQRDEARAQVTQTSAEMATLRTANQALGATVDQQNQAVARLKAEADAAENAMTARENTASSEATAALDKAEQQARALSAAPINAASGCEGAIQWGNARAVELSSW